ncbi:hypothetical protein [Flavihumibacter sp. UBA7668]|uniref:hypothetical protein n=1 Tax=Flavihumibacter sp. UBA7668 TaxID=1946542 RepID=UPI0025C5BE96|nr:hypothetical protein [Flavihumibacter sp. UBA7668]
MATDIIGADLVDAIRDRAREAELRGKLADEDWALVQQHNWLNLYLPAELKGRGFPFPDSLDYLEQLAYTDGSLGWTITLCSGAHWFLGFLDEQLRASLFIKDRLCLAGSGDAGGSAIPLDGGYWVEGSWPHATGAGMATHLTANLILNGRVFPFLFYADEVELFFNWTTMGMKATASHGFRVRPRWIPGNRIFSIEPEKAICPDPVFQYPFELIAAYTLAVNITGMAMRFKELANQSGKSDDIRFEMERKLLFENAVHHWQVVKEGSVIPPETIKQTTATARNLTGIVIHLVQDLYAGMGLSAAKEESEINRIWRNIHTAALHPLLRKIP